MPACGDGLSGRARTSRHPSRSRSWIPRDFACGGKRAPSRERSSPARLTSRCASATSIPEDVVTQAQPISFRLPNGVRASVYRADLLPTICEICLAARSDGALPPNQRHIAVQSELLVGALAHVGIIALVDEATDYVTLDVPEKWRYRTEAWRLTNGEIVVVVTEGGALSLANANPKIWDVIERRWDPHGTAVSFVVIEDWGEAGYEGQRFRVMNRDGISDEFDFAHWSERGIVAPKAGD